MRAPRTTLVLVGSPKGGRSTSGSLGDYLLARLAGHGVEGRALKVVPALKSEEAARGMLADVAAADLVVLSFPLYVDSLPAPAIRVLELIAASRAGGAGAADQAGAGGAAGPASFAAIVQSGFPEVEHNHVSLEICRTFADAAGFEWAGGLAMGAGGMIGAQPLEKVAGRVRTAVQALDLAAAALAAGRPVPDEAVQLMARPAFPPRLYRFMANMGWRSDRRKKGHGTPIDARPFA